VRRLAPILAALILAQSLCALEAGRPLEVRYYFSPECGSCVRFIDHEVPRVEKLLGRRITLILRDIYLPGILEELEARLAERKLTLTVLPVVIAGDTVLVGAAEITSGFETALRKQRDDP
jgi:hypothetical protein